MIIRRYNDGAASEAHAGTIRAHEVFPKINAVGTPFDSAWGYLKNFGALEIHDHPTQEIYIVFKGEGIVSVGDEKEKVSCGDIIEIPANAPHNIENTTEGELLWLAFWWRT
jgi:Mannose-6-phosphate isomerase